MENPLFSLRERACWPSFPSSFLPFLLHYLFLSLPPPLSSFTIFLSIPHPSCCLWDFFSYLPSLLSPPTPTPASWCTRSVSGLPLLAKNTEVIQKCLCPWETYSLFRRDKLNTCSRVSGWERKPLPGSPDFPREDFARKAAVFQTMAH